MIVHACMQMWTSAWKVPVGKDVTILMEALYVTAETAIHCNRMKQHAWVRTTTIYVTLILA